MVSDLSEEKIVLISTSNRWMWLSCFDWQTSEHLRNEEPWSQRRIDEYIRTQNYFLLVFFNQTTNKRTNFTEENPLLVINFKLLKWIKVFRNSSWSQSLLFSWLNRWNRPQFYRMKISQFILKYQTLNHR